MVHSCFRSSNVTTVILWMIKEVAADRRSIQLPSALLKIN